MPDDFSSMVNTAEAPITQGFQTGAQWGQAAAQNAVQIQHLKIQQAQVQAYQDTVHMKQGEWLMNSLRQIAPMENGPFKKGMIESFQQSAIKQGMNLDDNLYNALNDENYADKMSQMATAAGGLAGDPAYAKFFQSIGEASKAGLPVNPETIDGMVKAVMQLKAHQAQLRFETQKFNINKQDDLSKRNDAIEKQYSEAMSPAEKLFQSIPTMKDSEGKPVQDPNGLPFPDFGKMGAVDDTNLVQTLAEQSNAKARMTGQPEKTVIGGRSLTDWAKTKLTQLGTKKGAQLTVPERQDIWNIITNSHGANLASKRQALVGIANDTRNNGFDPNVTLGTNAPLMGFGRGTQAPAANQASSPAPETGQEPTTPAPPTPTTSQNAGNSGPGKYSPTLMRYMFKVKSQNKTRTQIESELGKKLPDDLIEMFGIK